MNHKVKYYLRWFLVLPVAIICHIIGYYFFIIINFSIEVEILKQFMFTSALGCGGIMFVVGGAITAPKYIKRIATLLSITMIITMIIGILTVLLYHDEFVVWDIIGNIFCIIGSIIGCFIIKEDII